MSLPIVTQRNRIPWSWAILMGLPWITSVYSETVSTAPMTFTMRRFIEDPRLISFIASINILFNFLVGVITCYLSDRIWTRWGRRRPFLIIGNLGGAISLACIPLAPTLPTLIAAIVAFQFFIDVGRPWEALFNEVIPAQQRGRACMFRQLLQNIGGLLFGSVLIGQWDSQYSTGGLSLNGEQVVYWVTSLVILGTALFHMFLVREAPPPPEALPEQTAAAAQPGLVERLKCFLRDVFGTRQAWGVYLLYFCPVVASSAAGAMTTLYMTEQLGISKADLGYFNLWTTTAMLALFAPLTGFLADRMYRIRMMQVGVFVPALIQLIFMLYLRWGTGFQVTMPLMIGVGLTVAFFQAFLFAVWGPVLYDYIPPNGMGTYTAGFTITSGLANFVLMNLAGWWVESWTTIFGNPGKADYDYSSIHVLGFILGLIALVGTLWFSRLVKRGIIRPVGQVERTASS